ncbi:hypothetical protein E3N88_05594 [Mikania micrantha]|uniref:Uncharacterized protein n=1 Tax=Mikania micrantha TaxID=192012 RepID=A0A5N6PLE0_9ASTR|nr:hypothetical protein E3N88_05594 [Mikania micrantha]
MATKVHDTRIQHRYPYNLQNYEANSANLTSSSRNAMDLFESRLRSELQTPISAPYYDKSTVRLRIEDMTHQCPLTITGIVKYSPQITVTYETNHSLLEGFFMDENALGCGQIYLTDLLLRSRGFKLYPTGNKYPCLAHNHEDNFLETMNRIEPHMYHGQGTRISWVPPGLRGIPKIYSPLLHRGLMSEFGVKVVHGRFTRLCIFQLSKKAYSLDLKALCLVVNVVVLNDVMFFFPNVKAGNHEQQARSYLESMFPE